ncbi:FecR family protein [Hyphococcus sp. DH-69]|uniref:FecR family protein n=1 Tax=Hyphococcus formosus TaxID=3143534 RepID=UPI00398AC669
MTNAYSIEQRRPELYEAALQTVRLSDRTRGHSSTFQSILLRKSEADPEYTKIHDVWDGLGQIEVDEYLDVKMTTRPRRWKTVFQPIAAAAMLFLTVGIVLFLSGRPPAYETAIGEQRNVMLPDGSEMVLNTDTRAIVRYDRNFRHLEIERGEAWFDVAHDTSRPFIVHAGDSQVRAVGTSFLVRRNDERVDVTLLSGIVEVTRGENSAEKIELVPGDRLRQSEVHPSIAIDQPQIEVVTAWRQGQLILNETPVAEALNEMNRYSNNKIRLASSLAAEAKLSGVFRLSDSRAFAESVAEIYDLNLYEDNGYLTLAPRRVLR